MYILWCCSALILANQARLESPAGEQCVDLEQDGGITQDLYIL